MASPSDPLVRIEGISAINGPAALNAILLDSVTATPYEGIWVPWQFVKQGSLEVSGSMSTLSLQLYGTNVMSPLNSYVVTIGGAATNNDVITLNVTTPSGVLVATYTVAGGNTVTQMAAGLVSFINSSVAFVAQGFQASNLAGVITLTWPSPPPTLGAGGFFSTSSPQMAPFVTISSSVSGSATETVAVAAGSGGSALGTAITALGMTQFSFSARWLKIRLTTLTGASASITAIAQGTA